MRPAPASAVRMIGGQCMTNTNLCGIQWHKYGMHCHCVVSGQMLHCGKHREQRFVDVAKIDRPYCAWVLREGGPAFGPFSDYLRSQHGGVMSVGKYKGHFFVTYGGKIQSIVHGRWD